jgi:hypothetical protein
VPFTVTADSFQAATPQPWSVTRVGRPARISRTFELHPNGERVVIVPAARQKPEHVILMLNFVQRLQPNRSPIQ